VRKSYVKKTFNFVAKISRQEISKYLQTVIQHRIFSIGSRDHAGPDALTLQF